MTLTVGSIFGGRSQTRQERSQEQDNRPLGRVIIRERPYGIGIYKRMWQVLSGDRRAVIEILRDTKKDLPAYFR